MLGVEVHVLDPVFAASQVPVCPKMGGTAASVLASQSVGPRCGPRKAWTHPRHLPDSIIFSLLSSPLLSLLFFLSFSLLLKPSLLLLLSFSLLLKPSLLLFLSVSLLLKPTLLLLLSFSLLLKPSLLLFLVFSSQAWCGSSARPDNDQATHSSDDTCPGSREFKTTQRNCYLSSRNFV